MSSDQKRLFFGSRSQVAREASQRHELRKRTDPTASAPTIAPIPDKVIKELVSKQEKPKIDTAKVLKKDSDDKKDKPQSLLSLNF